MKNPFRSLRSPDVIRADIAAKRLEIGRIEASIRGSQQALAARNIHLDRLQSELAMSEPMQSVSPSLCLA